MSAAAPLRLVLDTNVWLDWLVFDDATLAPLKRAQADGAIEIFSDEACTRELVAVLKSPQLAEQLKGLGIEPEPGTPAELARYTREEIVRFREVIQTIGLKPF